MPLWSTINLRFSKPVSKFNIINYVLVSRNIIVFFTEIIIVSASGIMFPLEVKLVFTVGFE